MHSNFRRHTQIDETLIKKASSIWQHVQRKNNATKQKTAQNSAINNVIC